MISLLPARCQHSSAGLARHRQRGAENSAGAAGGFGRTGSAFAPSPRAAGLGRGRAAVPTMRGCTRLALLCALPWLLPLVAPGRPAPPPALRRDPRNPARGAQFDRIYSGVVSLPTENIYSFNYTSQPGQVRHSLPALPGTCPTSEPRRCSGSPRSRPRETSGTMKPSFPFSFKAVTARAAASSATGLGTTPPPFAPPRPGRGHYWALQGRRFPAPSAGLGPLSGPSLGKLQFLKLRRKMTTPLFPSSRGEGTSSLLVDSVRPFYSIAPGEGELLRI